MTGAHHSLPAEISPLVTMGILEVCKKFRLGFVFLCLNGDLNVRRHFTMQLNRNVELAQLAQWLFQLQLAAVDIETFMLELLRDLGRGDGAKEMIVLAHLARKNKLHLVELLDK